MERVLCSVDILSLIFEDDILGSNCLARCARVRKIWFEPAVRVLWRAISDKDNLLRLLPTNGNGELGVCYKFDEEKDWARFKIYAKFVKVLVFRMKPSHNIADNTIQKIIHFPSLVPQDLLPNLEHLKVINFQLESCLNSVCFLRRGLPKLSIYVRYSPNNIYDIFNIILPQTPKLTYLELLCCSDEILNYTCPAVDFARTFKNLPHLEEIFICGLSLTSGMFLSLSNIPNLRSVDYFPPSTGAITGGASGLIGETNASFSSLEQVDLPLCTLTQLLSFSTVTPFPALKHLKVTGNKDATEEGLRSVSGKIGTQLKSLSFLQIQLSHYRLHFDTMCSFSSLRHLETVSISGLDSLTVTDSEMDSLAQSWPQLGSLRLECTFRAESLLTLSVLRSFSNHCKFLKFLTIHLDARKTSDVGNELAPMKYLKELDLKFSPISDPDPVVLYLSHLYHQPFSLKFFDISSTPLENATEDEIRVQERYTEGWKAVSKTLDIVLKVLDRERQCSANL